MCFGQKDVFFVKISEYISNEKDKMKSKPFGQRLAYYWDYYKWHILVALLALVLLGHTVSAKLTQKDVILNGILIDGTAPLELPAAVQSFYEVNGIDSQKQEMILDTGLALNSGVPSVVANTYQAIHARVGAQDADFVMGYEYAIQRLSYDTSHMFADLREIFSAEILANWEGSIYYIDGSVLSQIADADFEEIILPDPFQPENMKDPIPVALDVSSCTAFSSVYYSPDRPVYISVVSNAPNRELTARFIEFLLS